MEHKALMFRHNKVDIVREVTKVAKTIAVEGNLSPVKDFLTAQGCQVIDMEESYRRRADAVVISGSDQNLMGMQDMTLDTPVINASGKTPQQVWEMIMRYDQLQH